MKQLTTQTRNRALRHTQSEEEPTQRAPFRRNEPSHHDIERRAYELYKERNGAEGSALIDWLEAERELGFAAEDRAFDRDEEL